MVSIRGPNETANTLGLVHYFRLLTTLFIRYDIGKVQKVPTRHMSDMTYLKTIYIHPRKERNHELINHTSYETLNIPVNCPHVQDPTPLGITKKRKVGTIFIPFSKWPKSLNLPTIPPHPQHRQHRTSTPRPTVHTERFHRRD